jgi:hypothetical protein
MRNRVIIALVIAAAGCASPTAPHVEGIGGGSSGNNLLAFFTQPSTTVAGVEIAPAVQVAVVDSLGRIDTTFDGGITLSLVSSTVGAALSGTTTVFATSGVATFSDLSVSPAGAGYALRASVAGLAAVTSGSFDISAAAVSARPE